MAYTLHNTLTGDGLPGSNPETNFGNQVYLLAIQPRYNASSPMQGSLYNSQIANSPNPISYGKMGATPVNHPLTQRNFGINLNDLLGGSSKKSQSPDLYTSSFALLILPYGPFKEEVDNHIH